MTGVYAASPATFFRELAECLDRQTLRYFEWVIFVDGHVGDELETLLVEREPDERIKIIRSPQRVGIIRGLRRCLEATSGDFVVPVDADDLLEGDALQLLAGAIEQSGATFVYSDEDSLGRNGPASPYLRPDFDPVLLGENSYIWHLTAFRRDRAISLGVYQDPGAEYCHDWDTARRFACAKEPIGHVPHVLYHWRSHASSQSNSGQQNALTLESTKHVLEQTRSRLSDPERYAVTRFPLWRGAEEYYIERLPDTLLKVSVIVLLGSDSSRGTLMGGQQESNPTGHSVIEVRCSATRGWQAISSVLTGTSEYVALRSADIRPSSAEWYWEAVRILELYSDVAVVGGRIVDTTDHVVDCGFIESDDGMHVSPFAGRHRLDPGLYALALKPHCISGPPDCLLVSRRTYLKEVLERAWRSDSVAADQIMSLAEWLAHSSRKDGKRVAYSPLIEARRIAVPAAVVRSASLTLEHAESASGLPRDDSTGD